MSVGGKYAPIAAVDEGSESHYSILGVARDASTADIRKAYRAQALRWHPDKNPEEGAAEAFQAVAHAYGLMSQ